MPSFGLFPYINADGKTFEVDGKNTYAIDEETRLVEDGETVAMGSTQILATLAKGDEVEVKDNVITRTLSVVADANQKKAKAIKDYKDLRDEVITELGLMTKDGVEALSKGIAWVDINDSTVEELVAATNELEEAAAQAKAKAKLNSYAISKFVTDGERWSVDVTFSEDAIADLDSLVISLYKDGKLIGEQEATQANLDRDRGGWPRSATSPFYFDGTADELWEINEPLSLGTPDEIVVTFVLADETYTVTFTDVVV